MADRWKAAVCTIGGQPVAIVDVEIKRTLFIDPELFEKLRSNEDKFGLDAAGLTDAKDFIQEIQTIPADTRSFYVEPWTDLDNSRISMRPFAEIIALVEDNNVFRVTGDASNGFTGLLYVGGIERRFDMSRANLPAFQARLTQESFDAQEAAKNGDITQDQADAIDFICREAGRHSVACESLYDAHAKMIAEKNQKQREKEANELGAREREAKQDASSRGPRMSDSYSGLR